MPTASQREILQRHSALVDAYFAAEAKAKEAIERPHHERLIAATEEMQRRTPRVDHQGSAGMMQLITDPAYHRLHDEVNAIHTANRHEFAAWNGRNPSGLRPLNTPTRLADSIEYQLGEAERQGEFERVATSLSYTDIGRIILANQPTEYFRRDSLVLQL